MTKFYLLEGSSTRSYAYAFRDAALGSLRQRQCEVCGRTVTEWSFCGPHQFIVEGGPKYPDRLEFTGAGDASLILSARAEEIFAEHGVTGIEAVTPVQAVREQGTLPNTAPVYMLAQISGKIELDLPKMCLKKKNPCCVCGSFTWNRQRMHPLFLDEAYWDGSDICRVESIPGYVVCTNRVVELVKKQRLKGFSFRAL